MTLAVEATEEPEDYPDVSGVPSRQLQALFEEHLDCELTMFAERVGIEINYLRRLVVKPTVPVVRLKYADLIVEGLGLNLATLHRHGQITYVPLTASSTSARRLVDEEIETTRMSAIDEAIASAQPLDWSPPTEDEIEARVETYRNLHKILCKPTTYQKQKRAADAERTRERRAKEKGGS